MMRGGLLLLLLLSLILVSSAEDCAYSAGVAYHLRFGAHMKLDSNSFLGDHSAFTFGCWVKAYTTAEPLALIGDMNYALATDTTSGAGLYLFEGRVLFAKSPVPNILTGGALSADVELNKWAHVAVAFNASENGGTARLYVNGDLEITAGSLGAITVAEAPFHVGLDKSDLALRFSGQVDEVQVWNRPLSPSEIKQLWNRHVQTPQTGLLAYYVAEGDDKTVAIDRSGSGRNAKLVAGADYMMLNFFGFVVNCKGCFDATTLPRCGPWESVDVCGDGFVTGTEDCETGTGCFDCSCEGDSVPTPYGCVAPNETCVEASVMACQGSAECTNCSCLIEYGWGCLSNSHCTLYDMPALGILAWPMCISTCTGKLTKTVCYSSIPEHCVQYADETLCVADAACSWCTDHCADSVLDCNDRCGNGIVEHEVCDDGNTADGDGCSANCQSIGAGWLCSTPGANCTPVHGDGLAVGPEECDDGNTADGDGCSANFLVESGWTCNTTAVPSVCTEEDSAGAGLPLFAIIAIAAGGGVLVIAGAIALIAGLSCRASRKKRKMQMQMQNQAEPQVMAFVVDNSPGIIARPVSANFTTSSGGSLVGPGAFSLGSTLEQPALPTSYTGLYGSGSTPTPPTSSGGGCGGVSSGGMVVLQPHPMTLAPPSEGSF